MTPKCSECEHCKATPFADEWGEFYAFECESPLLDRRKFTGWIASGADDSALPKTCKRWCPLRKEKK